MQSQTRQRLQPRDASAAVRAQFAPPADTVTERYRQMVTAGYPACDGTYLAAICSNG